MLLTATKLVRKGAKETNLYINTIRYLCGLIFGYISLGIFINKHNIIDVVFSCRRRDFFGVLIRAEGSKNFEVFFRAEGANFCC